MTLNVDKTVPCKEFMENVRRHQIEMFAELDAYRKEVEGACRFHIFLWHRRCGKTAGIEEWAIKECIENDNFQIVFALPSYTHGQNIYWNDTRGIRYWLPKEEDDNGKNLYVKAIKTKDMIIEFNNGSIIKFQSGQQIDNTKGIDADVVIFDEYAVFDSDVMWKEHFLPIVLADKSKMAIFISTPRGRNHLFDLWNIALEDPEWNTSKKNVYETGVLDSDAIKLSKKLSGELLFRQEFLCDFLTDEESVHINYDILSSTIAEKDWQRLTRQEKYCGAIDPSEGGDEAILYIMRDYKIIDSHIFPASIKGELRPETIASMARNMEERNKLQGLMWIVDVNGCGANMPREMSGYGLKYYPFKGQEKPHTKEHLANLRTEAFDDVREGMLDKEIPRPKDDELVQQLTSLKITQHKQSLKLLMENKRDYKLRTKKTCGKMDCYSMCVWGSKRIAQKIEASKTILNSIRRMRYNRQQGTGVGV